MKCSETITFGDIQDISGFRKQFIHSSATSSTQLQKRNNSKGNHNAFARRTLSSRKSSIISEGCSIIFLCFQQTIIKTVSDVKMTLFIKRRIWFFLFYFLLLLRVFKVNYTKIIEMTVSSCGIPKTFFLQLSTHLNVRSA